MSVKVRYFASLGDLIGRSEDRMDIEGHITVADIWREATGEIPMPPRTLVAVNQEYADLEQVVHDGDEVAFFPPVTGG